MGKGNKLPELSMKDTLIAQFDEFFEKSSDPLSTLVNWNNELDDMTKQLREIGSDIKKDSSATPPPVQGELKIDVRDDGLVVLRIEKDGQPVNPKALDKVAKEYLTMVEKKAKLLQKRLKTIQKLAALENATFKVNPKKLYEVQLAADGEALEKHKKDEAVVDMQRSLTKFNDRIDLLNIQLRGPVTLAEAVSALINSMKDELKKKGQELQITIEDGLPKIEGIPESVEDFFPSLVAAGWSLLKQLIDFISNLKDEVPALQTKVEELGEEAKEFPGKLKDAATESGLGAVEMMKAGKAVTANIKTLASAPAIFKTLAQTLKDTSLELAGAVTGRAAAAGASPATPASPTAGKKEAEASSGSE